MESSEAGSVLRNRFNIGAGGTPLVGEEAELKPKPSRVTAAYEGEEDVDDGWVAVAVSWMRIITSFTLMLGLSIVCAVVMTLLLPWPVARLKSGSIYGHITGKLVMWILGNPVKFEGVEYSKTRAIYISNHASPLDILLHMWFCPTGTVGIAKKEIIWYPFFGQLYVLANHLRIDRTNPAKAIESIKEVSSAIVKKNLSLALFPEGTRSKTGRLLPFKKGFVHIALQSRLPIVPVLLMGTHRAWRKGSMHLRPVPLTVKFLPPITTDDWTADKTDEYVKMIHDMYVEHLPESQKPLELHG